MDEKRPVIGITPSRSKDNPSELVLNEKMVKTIEALGGEVYKIDYENLKLYELIGMTVQLDGIIFAGGVDVNPAFYGQEIEPGCGKIDDKRDNVELNMFPLILTRGLPVLGICRGCQVINVALGGTLIQDIPSRMPGANHAFSGSGTDFHHNVLINSGTQLYDAVKKNRLLTNSYHHQCVDELAPGLVATAHSEDGLIEAFELPAGGQFIMGVQWHPESTVDLDEDSVKIFETFMEAVKFFRSIPCHDHD